MEVTRMKKRGLSSDRARQVRADGHKDAFEFAKLIGLEEDYQNDAKAKKDVVDGAGDAHSLKSGAKKCKYFYMDWVDLNLMKHLKL